MCHRFLAMLLVLLAAHGAFAAASPSEYALLRGLSPSLQEILLERGEPDENGYVGFHQRDKTWYEAGMQRGGCRLLISAVVDGDERRADAAWRAIEVTFSHQLEDGGFLSNPKPGETIAPPKVERVETACFFLQECSRALLVIRDSPMAPHFQERVDALLPKLRRATAFIESGREALVWKVGHTANRLLIAAKAFGLSGVLLNDDSLKASAGTLVAEALKRRDADGVFIEKGGRDTSYDAVCMLMGQVLGIYLPNAGLDDAIHKTMAWLRTRIKDTGEVMVDGNTRTGIGKEGSVVSGHPKQVNYREVAQALAYYGLLHSDEAALKLAENVAHWKD